MKSIVACPARTVKPITVAAVIKCLHVGISVVLALVDPIYPLVARAGARSTRVIGMANPAAPRGRKESDTTNWRKTVPTIPTAIRLKLPFLIAGFASFLFSVWLYFVQDETTAGIFVGLWVPSIHSLGTLLLAPTIESAQPASQNAMS